MRHGNDGVKRGEEESMKGEKREEVGGGEVDMKREGEEGGGGEQTLMNPTLVWVLQPPPCLQIRLFSSSSER